MTGDIVVCFLKQTKADIYFCSRVGLFCSFETTANLYCRLFFKPPFTLQKKMDPEDGSVLRP